jgi:3-oxoacyl-[acyl-carrier-protein] synthase II
MDFANTVINAAAGQTALWHKLQGINSTLAAGACSGLASVGYAADLIRTGRAKAVLAGGAEELCFEGVYNFQRAGLLAEGGREDRAVPFGSDRNGFVLGEGAAFLVLEDAELARQRGAAIHAEILGWSTAFDPSNGRDRKRATSSAAAGIRRALADAGLNPGQVACAVAAANGSTAGDHIEALALAAAFDGDVPPLTAPKGSFGEALGAAGAFQALTLLESLKSGRLPGSAGADNLDKGLPGLPLAAHARDLRPRNGLIHAAGYDGNRCALVLGRAA